VFSVIVSREERARPLPSRHTRYAATANRMTSHSKALWELATCAGTEQATTTYHTKYNKHRPAERPYALGFLTRGRFLRFAQTNEGHTLLQVNCSRPGAGGGGRENFIRSVCSEFFSLCVEMSKTNEVQEGDYADVGAARNMRSDTYCTFPGFVTAIASSEFGAMRTRWRAEAADIPQPPPSSPPPSSSTNVVVGVPVEVAVKAPAAPPPSPTQSTSRPRSEQWPDNVVCVDTSDDDDDDKPPVPKAIRPRAPTFDFATVEATARRMFAEGMRVPYRKESRDWTKSNSGAVDFYTFDEWIAQRWSRLNAEQLEGWFGVARRALSNQSPDPPPPTPCLAPTSVPASAPKKKRNRDEDQEASTAVGTEHWDFRCLGFVIIRDYNSYKACAARGELVFDDKHEYRGCVHTGGYTILITQRQMGRSAFKTDGYVLLDGEAASRVSHATRSQPRLRSVPDIVRHFNANPDLNVASFLL